VHLHAHVAVQYNIVVGFAMGGLSACQNSTAGERFLWNLALAAFATTAEQYATSISRGDEIILKEL
jgi:hypothetical protein